MLNKSKKILSQEESLYNYILLLSRNKIFYTTFNLQDTFQNRINLIFIHSSFFLIKNKLKDKNQINKVFYQSFFDMIFKKIELNMREIGYGDVVVNKNMKYLVKTFYNILNQCENYTDKDNSLKNDFFKDYLTQNNDKIKPNTSTIISYFDQFQAFCFDLSSDSVLKGKINFNYK